MQGNPEYYNGMRALKKCVRTDSHNVMCATYMGPGHVRIVYLARLAGPGTYANKMCISSYSHVENSKVVKMIYLV